MCWSHHRYEEAVRERPARESWGESLDLRASDAERERVVEALRNHAAAGRLSPDELEERLERVYAATTRRDLRGPLADLPPLDPPPRRRTDARPEWVKFAVVAVVLLTIWALTGAGVLWPAWPLGFWAVGLLGGRRRGARGGAAMRPATRY